MHFRLGTDEFGRLECRIGGDGDEHSVQAADAGAALADLSAALDELEASGAAGCVWLISSGEYRWAFRRHEENVRVAVMFMHSVAIGYQHVYWGEHPLHELLEIFRAEIRRYRGQQA
ncbi:MAG: hypothetical protein KatS3mg004_0320 [Bryobacteraceae bacterium]|nr:MAG: hypothetical protein KatS3mg004_0320 [Bryobacteraceae bacterium]